MNRPDCDERSDSADKLANRQDDLPSSVTTDDGLSEAEDPESDNFDHHAGLSKAKALAMTAILGKNDHAAGDPSEAAGSPVPYPEVNEDVMVLLRKGVLTSGVHMYTLHNFDILFIYNFIYLSNSVLSLPSIGAVE